MDEPQFFFVPGLILVSNPKSRNTGNDRLRVTAEPL